MAAQWAYRESAIACLQFTHTAPIFTNMAFAACRHGRAGMTADEDKLVLTRAGEGETGVNALAEGATGKRPDLRGGTRETVDPGYP